MALGEKIKAFGRTPVGFVIYLAFIVLLSGFFVGELGIPVGALLMLLFAFGLPIYFGWKTSLRKLLIVALAIFLFAPLVTGLVVTQMAVVPSPVSWSGDNVLQNGSVDPYLGGSSGQVYHFQVQVWPTHLGPNLTLKAVYLWVTNCAYDTSSSQGACYLTPHDPFTNLSVPVSPAQANSTSPFFVYYNTSSLPKGQILYFMFLTAVASVGAPSEWIYALSTHYGGWSCTVPGGPPAGYSGCSYTQGPITGGWDAAYAYLLPDFYLSMALLVAVLVAVMLIYTYLKGREKMRLAKAKASATGDDAPKVRTVELRCPHCGAVVDKGETNCWKCKKDLSAPAAPAKAPDLPEAAPLPSERSGTGTSKAEEDPSPAPLSPK